MSTEPAYTPRKEYNCDNSTTHYQGCKCHESRRTAEIDALQVKVARLRDELVYQQTHSCRPFKDPTVEWRQPQKSPTPSVPKEGE